MRLILIILIAIIAFGVVQSYRHGCKFGEAGWYDCVMGRTAEAPTPATHRNAPSGRTGTSAGAGSAAAIS